MSNYVNKVIVLKTHTDQIIQNIFFHCCIPYIICRW